MQNGFDCFIVCYKKIPNLALCQLGIICSVELLLMIK